MRTNGYLKCPKCYGSGRIKDPVAQGQMMRAMRKATGKGLRETAALMGVSAAYVSDLELGRRAWNESITKRYKEAVRQ